MTTKAYMDKYVGWKKNGLKRNFRNPEARRRARRMRKLWREGMPYSQIAFEYGVTRQAVQQAIAKYDSLVRSGDLDDKKEEGGGAEGFAACGGL